MKLGTFLRLFRTEIEKSGAPLNDFADSEASAALLARKLITDQATLRNYLNLLGKNFFEGHMLCEVLGKNHLQTLFANDAVLTEFLNPLDWSMQAALCKTLDKEFHPMKISFGFHQPAAVEMKQHETLEAEFTSRLGF